MESNNEDGFKMHNSKIIKQQIFTIHISVNRQGSMKVKFQIKYQLRPFIDEEIVNYNNVNLSKSENFNK